MTQITSSEQALPSRATSYLLWVLCVVWAGVIFWFSAKTGSQIPGRFAELGHFGEYFIFGGLLYAALRASGQRAHAASIALIVASLYGVTDEIHQHFVPTRTPDVVDWGVDTLGAACGIIVTRASLAFARRFRDARPAETRA
jgi:VanZ family protein